jgi:2-haloacid dehalogenase
MRLSDFTAMSFDCYGTLIDWESGIVEALTPLTSRTDLELTRDQILEAHARNESAQQRWTPMRRYPELLAVVYKRLAEEWNVAVSWEECLRYGASVGDWPAFPDSREALAYLKQHYKLIILSNVDNASFAKSIEKLGVRFDAIYTAEDIGSYKPAARNCDYMTERLAPLGVEPSRLLHTAESLFHDHEPANAAGLACCWIHRRHEKEGFGATMPPGTTPRHDFRFTSMAELVTAHKAELL